jgi:hypothetical protein
MNKTVAPFRHLCFLNRMPNLLRAGCRVAIPGRVVLTKAAAGRPGRNTSGSRGVSMPETVVHFQIRMPPALHEQLASWAKEDKASLNALIVGLLEKAIEQHAGKSATKEKSLSA